MRILLAPDSFKGTLSAKEVCAILTEAFGAVDSSYILRSCPVADGGEGLCAALEQTLGGTAVQTETQGPFGEAMMAEYLLLEDQTAVIEMAACAGLPLAGERKNPELASTYGVGLLLRHAEALGAKKILLGLGGSATNDCGLGMAAALGYRFLDASGAELPPNGMSMARVTAIRRTERPFSLPVTAACDVDNPLYGPQGAAYVFAAQKGADAAMVRRLDEGLRNMARVIQAELGQAVAELPGAGAAGGLGAAVAAFLGGTLRPGIDIVLDAVRLDTLLEETDLVLTGEGKLDTQSLHGKVISGVAERARRKGAPVVLLCGCMEGELADFLARGIQHVYTCGVPGRSMEELQKYCRAELYTAAQRVARELKAEGAWSQP